MLDQLSIKCGSQEDLLRPSPSEAKSKHYADLLRKKLARSLLWKRWRDALPQPSQEDELRLLKLLAKKLHEDLEEARSETRWLKELSKQQSQKIIALKKEIEKLHQKKRKHSKAQTSTDRRSPFYGPYFS